MSRRVRVLVVDDSTDRQAKIADIVLAAAGAAAEIETASNVHQATEQLRRGRFDLMVLDIMLPMRADAPARPDGGMTILRALKRDERLLLPDHILGLTAHQDLRQEFEAEFNRDLWFVVPYEPSSSEWADAIEGRVRHLARQVSATFSTDLAIVTALHEFELESVLGLDAGWTRFSINGDDTIYQRGEFRQGETRLTVVAASAVEMGMCAAATVSMKVIEHFRPRYSAMVGVAAGVKAKPGDILIANQSWDYGSGKSVDAGAAGDQFHPAPNSIPLSEELKNKFSWFTVRSDACRRIEAVWDGPKSDHPLNAWIGPVASGAAVLANRRRIDEILSHNRNLIGVEMEIYGVFMAARTCTEPRPSAFAIKSMMDSGDEKKNDHYKKYAAFTSARFLYEFAIGELA